MNIKRAKQEIRDTIESYLLKDESGEYEIPQIRQRPVLMLGAPGIGKTQIMEQIAKECGIALVSYTITHHTRQSAIGLPYISKHSYGGKEYSVTEYTMSEIVASIYNKMEKTGLSEGILFIDEINCVSETLAPAMLQFLQCKTFGSRAIPQGWIIVAAGNPPEYNKSVREFDVVTMDRVKKIEVEPDYAVWKEYAVKEQLHPAVISYLDARTANFYRMETTVDGRKFATPRGWEDLSQMLVVYEKLGKTMDREVVVQYIQHEKTAKDFANYLELYYKYQMDYQLDEVLSGNISDLLLKKAAHAPFDERLSVVSLLLARCRAKFAGICRTEGELGLLFEQLKQIREKLTAADACTASPVAVVQEAADAFEREYEAKRAAELLTRREDRSWRRVLVTLEEYARRLVFEDITCAEQAGTKAEQPEHSVEQAGAKAKQPEHSAEQAGTKAEKPEHGVKQTDIRVEQSEHSAEPADSKASGGMAAFEQLRAWFNASQDALEEDTELAGQMLEHAFDFIEAAFGAGQEMVIFITELNSDYYSVRFLQEYECERYYRYNKQLLFDESGRAIEEKLRQMGR